MELSFVAAPLKYTSYHKVSKLVTRWIKKKPLPGMELSVGETLIIWFFDLLSGTKLFTDVQVTAILNHLHAEFISIVDKNFNPYNTTNPAIQFLIVDRRFITMSFKDKFYDVVELEEIEVLPYVSIELISYNLTKLFFNYRDDADATGDDHVANDL